MFNSIHTALHVQPLGGSCPGRSPAALAPCCGHPPDPHDSKEKRRKIIGNSMKCYGTSKSFGWKSMDIFSNFIEFPRNSLISIDSHWFSMTEIALRWNSPRTVSPWAPTSSPRGRPRRRSDGSAKRLYVCLLFMLCRVSAPCHGNTRAVDAPRSNARRDLPRAPEPRPLNEFQSLGIKVKAQKHKHII